MPTPLPRHPQLGTLPRRIPPSAIERLRECPRRFLWQDIERRRVCEPETPQLAVGNAIHAALERFHRLPADERDFQQLQAALRSVWRTHCTTKTFATTAKEKEAGLAALEILHNYWENFPTSTPSIAVEKTVSCSTLGPSELSGRIDRIDPDGLGGCEIVDYKTGRRWIESEDLPDDPAAQIYLLAVEETLGLQVSCVRFLYLATGEELRWHPEREDIETIRERLKQFLVDLAHTDEFPPWPGAACFSCPFRLECTAACSLTSAELATQPGLPF